MILMRNVAWFVLVPLVILHAQTPTRTVVVSTAVLMRRAKVVSVNATVVSKPFSLVKIEIVFSTHAKKSPQLQPQPLLQLLQQLPLQQHQLLLLNVFQIVIWIALVSVVWLSVTHLIAEALVEVDSLLPAST